MEQFPETAVLKRRRWRLDLSSLEAAALQSALSLKCCSNAVAYVVDVHKMTLNLPPGLIRPLTSLGFALFVVC